MKKYYLFILFLISFKLVSAQLSPQSKKITEKFLLTITKMLRGLNQHGHEPFIDKVTHQIQLR